MECSLNKPPCETCKLKDICTRECLVFNHWVDTGKILTNIMSVICA